MDDRLRTIQQIGNAIQGEGLPGMFQTLGRMIAPGCPAGECISTGEACMAGAATAEEVWDCAKDFSACLNESRWSEDCLPDLPDVKVDDRASVVVLATLLTHLHHRAKASQTYTPPAKA